MAVLKVSLIRFPNMMHIFYTGYLIFQELPMFAANNGIVRLTKKLAWVLSPLDLGCLRKIMPILSSKFEEINQKRVNEKTRSAEEVCT